MAKKNAAPKSELAPDPPKRGRPKGAMSSREANIHVRCSEAWRDWVKRYARFRQLEVSSLIGQVVSDDAERHGFKERAPYRKVEKGDNH